MSYLQIVAREVGSSDQLHSSALVTVNLVDKNDNLPVFERDKYEVDVHENEENGKVILKVGSKKDFAKLGTNQLYLPFKKALIIESNDYTALFAERMFYPTVSLRKWKNFAMDA